MTTVSSSPPHRRVHHGHPHRPVPPVCSGGPGAGGPELPPAVFNAMALLDLEPVYLERSWLEQENLIGPITPEQVEISLKNHPNIKTVCITSPTYAGVLSDIEAISSVIHAYGGRLFVDGAHGAHLPFLGLTPFAGADGGSGQRPQDPPRPGTGRPAVHQRHGPGPGCGGWPRCSAPPAPPTPSWPAWTPPGPGWRRTGPRPTGRPPSGWPSCAAGFSSLAGDLSLDPARLTLNVQDGPSFARSLEEQNIFPEMEDGGPRGVHLHPPGPGGELRPPGAGPGGHGGPGWAPVPPSPPLPCRSGPAPCGRPSLPPPSWSPCTTAPAGSRRPRSRPIPPVVPVVAPGERISEKELAYFRKIGYNSTDIPVIVSRDGEV